MQEMPKLAKLSVTKRLVPLFGIALVTVMILSSLGAASASATTQQWWSCPYVGESEGGYTDAACKTAGKGSYEWKTLSSSTFFTQEGTSSFALSATIGGVPVAVTCSTLAGAGWAENPAGEGAGTFTLEGPFATTLSGCTVKSPEPESCKVKGGTVKFVAVKGEATEFGGAPAIKYVPIEGTTFAIVTLEGCKTSSNNGGKKFTGTLYGVMSSKTPGVVEFTEASSSSSKFGGATARFEGSAALETEASGPMRAGLEAPVNYAQPTISPESLTVGSVASASTGGWTNAPTSYSYQWKRCNHAGVECIDIAGATSSTYTMATADEEQTLAVKVTATNPRGSTSATSATSPVASVLVHWYACKEVEAKSGSYTDSACQNAGLGSFEWSRFTAGVPSNVTLKNSTPVTYQYILSGVTISFECTSQESSGTLSNPSGGGAGTLVNESASLLTLKGCVVLTPEPTKCKLKNGEIWFSVVTGTGTELSGKPAVKFSPLSGSTLFGFTIEGCGTALFNGPKTATGSVTLPMNNSTSALEFSKAGSSEIKFGGLSNWFEGGSGKLTAAGGEVLKLARNR